MININGLINKVNLMPNNKDKAMKTCLIYSYINFLVDSNQLEKSKVKKILEQINDIDIFFKHYITDEKKEINSILNSIYYLNPIYKDILNYANNYPLFNIDLPNANIENLIKYAKDFLNYIDPNLIKLFNRLIDNQLIVETSVDDYGGKCHKLNGNVSGIIIRYDTLNFYKVLTVVHEMGHAYYHYLNKCFPNLIRSNIANECIPRIFEQLFLIYLKENYLIDENSLNKYERYFMLHQINITNAVYIVNKLLMDNIINDDFNIDNIKTKMSFNDFYNLSIIKPKNNDFQKYLLFTNNYYSYAFILSSIIRENYLQNKDDTIKFIKEIPSLSIDFDALEFIDLFSKNDYLNATKKNISRVLSKTHYKK